MNISPIMSAVHAANLAPECGKLTSIQGSLVEAVGCKVQLGELVRIVQQSSRRSIFAEVIGLREQKILLMPYMGTDGLCLDSFVEPLGRFFSIPVGLELLGRVIDPLGKPLDEQGPIQSREELSTHATSINPLHREAITQKLFTGVKAIDVFTPVGKGQRIGIFSGSGVGKSTLLGMMAKFSSADVIVIGLIGERGREVGDFIRENLGKEGLARSVLVVATASEPAVLRRQAALTATTVAEWFRNQGKDVLLIMDSITRFAMAQREIGLSVGEPIGTRGYPPSALASLPLLVERCGNLKKSGSISAVYTVLVEGDDLTEPVSDHMRAILDGHVTLDRNIAMSGVYPAIDILQSISRLADKLHSKEERARSLLLRSMVNTYKETKEIIDLGLYKVGSNIATDRAVKLKPAIEELLKQSNIEAFTESDLKTSLEKIDRKVQELGHE